MNAQRHPLATADAIFRLALIIRAHANAEWDMSQDSPYLPGSDPAKFADANRRACTYARRYRQAIRELTPRQVEAAEQVAVPFMAMLNRQRAYYIIRRNAHLYQ